MSHSIVAVIPFLPDFHLEEEDRIKAYNCLNPEIDIAVVYLPHISNASDFYPLSVEKNVQVRFVRSVEALGCPDLIILPGSKNTPWDLEYVKRTGWEQVIHSGIPVMGICGGFEMMGKTLYDPYHAESPTVEMAGFGLFDFNVHFQRQKRLHKYAITRLVTICLQMLERFLAMKFTAERCSTESEIELYLLQRMAWMGLLVKNR